MSADTFEVFVRVGLCASALHEESADADHHHIHRGPDESENETETDSEC